MGAANTNGSVMNHGLESEQGGREAEIMGKREGGMLAERSIY